MHTDCGAAARSINESGRAVDNHENNDNKVLAPVSQTRTESEARTTRPFVPIRILIIDDHPIVRYGLRFVLEAEHDIEVVGELESIEPIVDVLPRLDPDIVILDLELGEVRGVEALQKLRDVAPELRVVVYTSHSEDDYIVRAAELGVDGYLLKGSRTREIVNAVRQVFDGGTAIESKVAAKLMQHMDKRSTKPARPAATFSRREKQVLKLLAEGLTNRDIGARLFISESTVKFHVHAILSKLNANNRTEAVSLAVQQGVISLDTDSRA